MPSGPRSGWGRTGHRRAVLIGSLAFALVVGGGVAAWAEVSGGNAGYRMATVTRADIGTALTVVGNVEPVSDAAAAFQVGGKVATVDVTPGTVVTAGETLGTLDTTALSETVSSAQSSLNSDEAKLAEDEANESSSASSPSGSNNGANSTTPSTSTTTTSPGRSGGTPTGGGQSATITADQNVLTKDQSTLSQAQQQEAADLAQAQSDCTSANTSTPTGQAACEAALQTVSADEQQVSKDQSTVSKDESTLAQALSAASSAGGDATGNSGSSPTAHAAASDPTGSTGNTGSGGGGGTGGTGTSPRNAGTSTGSTGSTGSTSGNTDTPEQIASDQAAIDTAEANLTEAQQSLKEATLTSPINGTVVSVAIGAGSTVSAGSSTAIITIVGTKSYEAQATLDSSQIPSVKVGQTATVEVDGVDGSVQGTVSQVGPVQSTSSGYSYPVVVALPDSLSGLYSGSTANLTISTGTVSNVVAVPTSAVQTLGSSSYVMEIVKGQLTRKDIKVGMVGDAYTQVDSGLSLGQSVVLVDYAEPVPSSNTNTTSGLGGFLGGGGGGGGFFPGGGVFNVQRVGGGPGAKGG
ncbi:MAG TPA: efflux RND transporter periplasmic adaptor subunit [Acidimicrobiales bacterium]|nr:efflux RND transporter periplasmic adaptor subunit [Acidimicrobiales bacterium]